MDRWSAAPLFGPGWTGLTLTRWCPPACWRSMVVRAVSWELTHTFEWVFSVLARLDAVDFDVLVHTNVLEVGGYADEPPLEQRAAAQAHLFRQLYDPDRQRAVINIDGAPRVGVCTDCHQSES